MRPASVVTGLLLLLSVPSVSLAGVPSAANSFVPQLVGCPAGDLSFSVLVRDAAFNPVPGSVVTLSFTSCPSFIHCSGSFSGYFWNSAARTASAVTDSIGQAHFAIHQGGICSVVSVTADGVPLASRAFASTDQNADLQVDFTDEGIVLGKLGTTDRTADFDGNGVVDTVDVVTVASHIGHDCSGTPPPAVVANAGPDITACSIAGGTAVQLNGTASQGTSLVFTWSAPGITFDDPHSATPTGIFPSGSTAVLLEVVGDQGSSQDEVFVTVRGSSGPSLDVSLTPSLLWPPNNRLVPIHATVSAFDSCGVDTVTLFSITVIDGDSTLAPPGDDVQGAALGTADFEFSLRAERTQGAKRTYVVCYQARNPGGQATEVCREVVVARDQPGQAQFLTSPSGRRLTLYGSAEHDAASVNGSSILLRSGDEDLFLFSGEPPSLVDVNGDSFMDAVFTMTPTGSAFGDGQTLWARWNASSGDHLAQVETTPLGIGPEEIAFGVRVSPNPVSVRASLVYSIPAQGHVRLRIFDVSGRAVATLVDGVVEAGRHTATFEGGRQGSASLYFYTLEAHGRRASGKFVMVK